MAKKESVANLSVEELGAKLTHLDRELFALRNELATNRKLEKPHLLKLKRREKARILTALTQKQRAKGVA